MGVDGGVTKCQTDSQCGDQTTTWLVTDAGLRGTYSTSVTFLNFRPQYHQPLWMEGCYPQSAVFAAFGLWQLHPRCSGTVSGLPWRRWDAAVMRGPRCILGSSAHIFQHFHSKCETFKLGTGNNYSHRCNAEENTALILDFRTNNFSSEIMLILLSKILNIVIHNLSLEVAVVVLRWAAGETGRRGKRIFLTASNLDHADLTRVMKIPLYSVH